MNTGPETRAVHNLSAPPVRLGLAMGVIASALALDVGSLNVLNAALPAIGTRFGLDNGTLQWVMTAYSVTFAGFLLLSGRIADVLGRRLVFAAGIGLFTAAALAGALAPTAGVLIVARAAQGIGAAFSGPAALALISEVFAEGPPRNRGFGVYAAVGSVSASSGLVLGGVLTQLLGWRSVFAVSVVFGALVLVAIKPALPASVRHPHSLDWLGASAVTIGLILVVFGVSRVTDVGWANPVVVVSLVVAAVLLAAFVVWEHRAKEPLMPLALFRVVSVRAGSLTAVVSYTTVIGLTFFAPLYLQDILRFSPLESAVALMPLSIAVFVVATYGTARLLRRFGQRPMLISGLVLVALGIASWTWTTVAGNYWWQALPGIVVVGLGMGLAFPAMTAASLTGVPPRRHGVAGAINVVAQQIGASVGLVVLSVVATATRTSADDAGTLAGYHTAYLTAAVLCVLAVLVIGFGGNWHNHPEAALES